MVTEEEAVEIATRLVQEKVKEPWKFNSVHLVEPEEVISKLAWLTPYQKDLIRSASRKEWMVLFDVAPERPGQAPNWTIPQVAYVGVAVNTGDARFLGYQK